MKKIYKILLFLNLVFIVSCDKKEKHLTSKDFCEEKLPPFIEKFDGQFDKEKLNYCAVVFGITFQKMAGKEQ